MIGIIRYVLAGIVIAYLLVSAATNRKINEKELKHWIMLTYALPIPRR